MLEGYSLTTYFMAKAHGRNKRNKIYRKIVSFKGIITGFCMLLILKNKFLVVGMIL
jgi:hypothetical protein